MEPTIDPKRAALTAEVYAALNSVSREFIGFIPAYGEPETSERSVDIGRVAFWAMIAVVITVTLGLLFWP